MPFMKPTHQVAQELRGLAGDGSKRVRDLVDLQVIIDEEPPSLEGSVPNVGVSIRFARTAGGRPSQSNHL